MLNTTKIRVAYKAFLIDSAGEPTSPNVRVFDPRFRGGPIYRTTSLERAMNWIDGYRDGFTWALNLALHDPC